MEKHVGEIVETSFQQKCAQKHPLLPKVIHRINYVISTIYIKINGIHGPTTTTRYINKIIEEYNKEIYAG